jgi:16S rRNA (cytosine1402-N4)-methyltransferase
MTATGDVPRRDASLHQPVLVTEVLAAIEPRDGERFIDGTFGGGGYTRALLEAADCAVWGFDRDREALDRAADLVTEFPSRLTLIHGRFGDMRRHLAEHGITAVDGVVLDFGVSSFQLDTPARGFSFRQDGPLDMRMDRSSGIDAEQVVNGFDKDRLAEIIRDYGDERRAAAIAAAIVRARAEKPIRRTSELAALVGAVVRRSRDGIDPATRTFQALRIYVNDELGEIDRGLDAAECLLRPGGRLAAVSFHSLEDRRVKTFLRERAGEAPRGSRHLPAPGERRAATFRLLSKRPIRPTPAEIVANPRARSARLRAAERVLARAGAAERAVGGGH